MLASELVMKLINLFNVEESEFQVVTIVFMCTYVVHICHTKYA